VKDALVICTRNRPQDVRSCLESVLRQTEAPRVVLVADGSSDERTAAVAAELPDVRYVRVEPGLTRQRNAAVRALERNVELVHFVDDDTVLEPGYVAAIRQAFADPSIGGVGGVIKNIPPRRPRLLYRLFLLDSRRSGVVLRSGRNVLAADVAEPADVDWLSGCTMSFRAEVLRSQAFDESRLGYCLGEDVDYSLRVGERWRLVVTPYARLEHMHSPIGRYSAGRWYAAEVVERHQRVALHRGRLSRTAFWWSIAGEVGLGLAKVLGGRRAPLRQVQAVLVGCWCILRKDQRLIEG
jgi:GT2 family glycosyltransferase